MLQILGRCRCDSCRYHYLLPSGTLPERPKGATCKVVIYT